MLTAIANVFVAELPVYHGTSADYQYFIVTFDHLFPEKIPADGVDLASGPLFYSDSRICPVSDHRAGFS